MCFNASNVGLNKHENSVTTLTLSRLGLGVGLICTQTNFQQFKISIFIILEFLKTPLLFLRDRLTPAVYAPPPPTLVKIPP